ncbi:MAG: hypothetical protein IKF19_04330 [Bacilli bacterium]|nr:hypothetical protein [Bacilli bacterium]
MEEINLTELFRYFLKRLPIIIGVTIIGVLIGFLYVKKVQVPMYHGTTTIILVQKEEDNRSSNNVQSDLSMNQRLVSTYSHIIKSRRVLDQVINNLKLKTKAGALAGNIEISAISDTSIIKITVSNKSNKESVRIANEVAKVFKSEVTNIYNLENVSIVDSAIVESTPYNINLKKQVAISGLMGMVLSCVVIFIIYYFDNTIKTKDDIVAILDIPVLAEVPTVKKLRKKRKVSSNGVRTSDVNSAVFSNIDKKNEESKDKKENKETEEVSDKKVTSKRSTTTKRRKTTSKKEKGDK